MRRIVLWGLLAMLAGPVIAAAEDKPASPEAGKQGKESKSSVRGLIVDFNSLPDDDAVKRLESDFVGYLDDGSKYWIGLSCDAVDDTLRSQLGLEAGSGLVIRQVVDGGPAAKAGFQVHDIITQATIIGGKTHKPTDIAELTALVQEAGMKPMTFVVMRGSKLMNFTVAPAERKTVENSFKSGLGHYDSNLIYMHTPGQPNPFLFRMTGPVVALGGALPGQTNLPDDLTVVITKSGSQPVEITVRQKDRGEWKLKEKETAAQPEQVSQAVMGVLSYLSHVVSRVGMDGGQPTFTLEPGPQANLMMGPVPINIDMSEPLFAPITGTPANAPAAPRRHPPTLSSLQQRLDEIQKQQEQVTKTLEELRQVMQKQQIKK